MQDEIAAAFDLGLPLATLVRVGGGNVHRMWRLDTDRGSWAVKQLRPETRLSEYLATIELERAASEAGVPCPRAIASSDGSFVVQAGGAQVRVHEWVDGATPGWEAAPSGLAWQIGSAIARVHLVGERWGVSDGPALFFYGSAFWDDLRERSRAFTWSDRLDVALVAEDMIARATSDPVPLSLVHGDANQKNVVVDETGRAMLCDWDAMRRWSPRHEAAAMVLEWAGVEVGEPARESAASFLDAYAAERRELRPFDETDVVAWVVTWLAFTAFNVRRCIGAIPRVDDEERGRAGALVEMGIAQMSRFAEASGRWTQILNQ